MAGGTAWKRIRECPDDTDRPGGPRTWRLLCNPHIAPGRTYDLGGTIPQDEANTGTMPFETIGRRTTDNDTGWVEVATRRELDPTHFAPPFE